MNRNFHYFYSNNLTEPLDNYYQAQNINNNDNENIPNTSTKEENEFNLKTPIKLNINKINNQNNFSKDENLIGTKISFNNIKKCNSTTSYNVQNKAKTNINPKKITVIKIKKINSLNQTNKELDYSYYRKFKDSPRDCILRGHTTKNNILSNTEFREKRKIFKINNGNNLENNLKYNYSNYSDNYRYIETEYYSNEPNDFGYKNNNSTSNLNNFKKIKDYKNKESIDFNSINYNKILSVSNLSNKKFGKIINVSPSNSNKKEKNL